MAAVASGEFRYPFITWGPRTSSSPASPRDTSAPVAGSTTRISVLGSGTPTDPGLGPWGALWLVVTTGLVSVRPQPCMTSQPSRSAQAPSRLASSGAAPEKIDFSDDRS